MRFPNRKDISIDVDDNPTQIADVETAVEREGASARRGTDIDVTDFLYQSETSIAVSDLVDISMIDDLIDEEIERLGANEASGDKKVTKEKVEEKSRKGAR